MANEISIFKQGGVARTERKELSELSKSLVSSSTIRSIKTTTNGTFKRVINGEQVGKAIRGEFNAIIIAALPKVSRAYYAKPFDPDAEPTAPDCWANLGDVPDAGAANPQAKSCQSCKQNIDGTGQNGKGKACRFSRKIALLLEGDTSGDPYQFNVPAKSLFGKGQNNTHPFESYVRFLANNFESLDSVVTTIAYDLDAETMVMNFTPARAITDEEEALVKQAQANPEVQNIIKTTARPKWDDEPKGEAVAEPEEEEPKKRAKKAEAPVPPKASIADIVNAWGDDE